MSSIYKKGRDGYFYYQAYIFNPKTKKKDKKIFHSLRTKNKNEAEIKKIDLDNFYEKKRKKKSIYKKEYRFTPFGILSGLALIIFLSSSSSIYFYNTSLNKKNKIISNLSDQTSVATSPLFKIDESIKNDVKQNKVKIIEKEKNNVLIKKNNAINDGQIASFNIERVKTVSGKFKQGEIYVTIEANLNIASQIDLCRRLKSQFPEFLNITICLYADNQSGIALSKGFFEKVSLQETKKNWLAMFTYNSVEGEYFDNSPATYLSNY